MKKTSSVLAAALLLGLASCSDENPWMGEAGQGAIRLSLTADSRVEDSAPKTRGDISGLLEKMPEASDFNIHLEKADGSYSKIHTHDDFLKIPSFPTGAYTLRAYCGSPQEEGFDCPYFEGTTEVTVLEARETEAHVNASIANTLISIKYGEGFSAYMADYRAQLHSAGGSYIDYAKEETRPAFVHPGTVTLSIDITNKQGQSVTLQPAEFEAEAGHHYTISLNVNGGNMGEGQLKVEFDDALTEENVYIDLTEELFTAPAPTVTLAGIDAEAGTVPELEFLAGEAPDGQYRFHVISHGVMKKVIMTLKGEYEPAFGHEIDLISATDAQQQQLAALGIDCKGIFRNPDKMAIVDFSNLPKNLPAGEYELSLRAMDMLTRVSDAVTVKINSVAPELTVDPLSAIFGLNQGSLTVNYNGSHPETDITFQAMNTYGVYVDAPVVNCVEQQNTRAITGRNYLFNIRLADTAKNPVPVRVYLYGKLVKEVELPVEYPEYELAADGFARKAMIKVTASEEQLPVIAGGLKLYEGGSAIAESRITRDVENGLITVSGLTPERNYDFVASLVNAATDPHNISFTTEKETDVTNGDFSQMSRTINIDRINAGGIYTYKAVGITGTYRNKSSIVVDTPTGWGNINSLTCDYDGSANKNTWYVVPSTIGNVDSGTVTVRTVGYSHNGVEPETWTAETFNYYSENAPARTAFDVAAGQLYYGDSASTGAAFTTRPSGVAYDYSYAPVNNETALVEVKVLAGGEVIGSGKTTFSGGSNGSVDIAYTPNAFGKKATSLSIVFYSSSASNPEINIPSGAALKDNNKTSPDSNILDRNNPDKNGATLGANAYNSKATGSELTVSNVKLNY